MKFQYLLLFVFGCTVNCSVIHDFGIIGGNPINITDAPYMAMLRAKGQLWGCGASIVHKQFLVTAAHCCGGSRILHATVGTDHVESGDNYEIDQQFKHPKYDPFGLDYDICVVKLKKQLKWNDKVKPIVMADMHHFVGIKNGDILTTMGFGLTETGNASKILLSVKVPYTDQKTCQKELSRFEITSRMLCAGGIKGKDSCHGDSGGPIIYKDNLAGAVSFGDGCAKPHKPGVYAYLPAMRDFVDHIIQTK